MLRQRAVAELAKDGALRGAWVVLRLPAPSARLEDAAEDQPVGEPGARGGEAGPDKR